MMGDYFYGHPYSFWIELKDRTDKQAPFGYEKLLDEIIFLRGKVAFYEERIKQMAYYKDKTT